MPIIFVPHQLPCHALPPRGASCAINLTSTADVLQVVPQAPTDVTGQAVEVTTQGEPVHPCTSSSINCDTVLPTVSLLSPVITSKFHNRSVPLPLYPTAPIKIAVLEQELTDYPDLNMRDYLVSGFRHGFAIGYEGPHFPLISNNLPSTRGNQEPVTAAIVKELERGHIAGAFVQPPLKNLRSSPLGAVPKNDGTSRLIIDLSSPNGL